jgi:hypothetical protein
LSKIRLQDFKPVIPGRALGADPESNLIFRSRVWIPGSRAFASAPERQSGIQNRSGFAD